MSRYTPTPSSLSVPGGKTSRTSLLLLGAAGLWLGFPNPLWHLPPLALFYPAALCLLGVGTTGRGEALRLGWLTGLIGASSALYWLALPVHDVGGLPWLLAVPCALAIGAYVGLYGGFFSLCAHTLRQRDPLTLGLALGVIWYFLEMVRGTLFTGFPWLSLATAFAPWPAMIQGAVWVGGYALGGVWAAAACLLALAGACATRGRTPSQRIPLLAPFFVGCLLLALPAAFGLWRLHTTPPDACALLPDAFPVILVEGNIDQNQKWEHSQQQATVDIYVRLSREALAAHVGTSQHPPLIIWPETSMPFYLQTHPVYTPQVQALVREAQAPLLLGAPGVKRLPRDNMQIFNRAYLIHPDGKDVEFYDKIHLVPFGEYLPPWLAFDFLKPLLQGVGDFTPGLAAAPLRSGRLALGMLICYESIFPEIARQRVADGANVLVNISNDGWFGDSAAPEQHLQLAVLRAVEQGRWLVRGTNTGISAIVDPLGRIVLRGAQFCAQSLSGYARPLEAHTPYFSSALWLPWVAAAFLMLLLCLPRANRASTL